MIPLRLKLEASPLPQMTRAGEAYVSSSWSLDILPLFKLAHLQGTPVHAMPQANDMVHVLLHACVGLGLVALQ